MTDVERARYRDLLYNTQDDDPYDAKDDRPGDPHVASSTYIRYADCALIAERFIKAAGLVPLAEVKAVLESARDAYSDHPGLSDRPEFQHATQVVTTDFFRDLMAVLETRFDEAHS